MSAGETLGTPRVRRADLLVQSWGGFVSVLHKRYDRDSLVLGPRDIQVFATASIENAEKDLQAKKLDYEYPFIAVALSSVDPNPNSFNAAVMRRFGYRSRLSSDRSTWSMLALRPVIMTLQVMMVTDDMMTMMRMIDRWMSNQLWSFSLEDVEGDFWIGVRASPDESFSIAPRAPDSGGTSQFRQSVNVRLETYAGVVFYVPSIYRIDLQTEITEARDLSALERDGVVDAFDLTTVITAPDHEPEA